MPKRSSWHGGAKQMFTKYAQHKDGYIGAQQKKSGSSKNPDSLVFTCIHFGLITEAIMGERAVKGAKHRKRLALDSCVRSMIKSGQAEMNKYTYVLSSFCHSGVWRGITEYILVNS
jgi:predicted GIY-YIG superfamily endonuclease